jgi:hypothetical protein
VLRLRGSEPSCLEAGSNCVVTPPNRELSEPFGRSGTLVHITFDKYDSSKRKNKCEYTSKHKSKGGFDKEALKKKYFKKANA